MNYHPDVGTIEQLQGKVETYDEANIFYKLGLLATGKAARSGDRDLLRREEIGSEGRIVEDAIRLIEASPLLQEMTSEKTSRPTMTQKELHAIRDSVTAHSQVEHPNFDVSHAHEEEAPAAIISEIVGGITGDRSKEINAYVYAVLHGDQPYLVALQRIEDEDTIVHATIPLDFLAQELTIGTIDKMAAPTLEAIVAHDLDRTYSDIEEMSNTEHI